jgi:hypothetical protein
LYKLSFLKEKKLTKPVSSLRYKELPRSVTNVMPRSVEVVVSSIAIIFFGKLLALPLAASVSLAGTVNYLASHYFYVKKKEVCEHNQEISKQLKQLLEEQKQQFEKEKQQLEMEKQQRKKEQKQRKKEKKLEQKKKKEELHRLQIKTYNNLNKLINVSILATATGLCGIIYYVVSNILTSQCLQKDNTFQYNSDYNLLLGGTTYSVIIPV